MILRAPHRIQKYIEKRDFTAPIVCGYKGKEVSAAPIVHDRHPGVYLSGKFVPAEEIEYIKT